MPQPPSTIGFVRSLRLSDDELKALLDDLDGAEGPDSPDRRNAPRYRFRDYHCVFRLKQPGDASTTPFLAATRNLSVHGMSLIHGGFVHTGSRCVVQLISIHGSWENVSGVVVECRHFQDSIHEVRIVFDNGIDPGMYCSEATTVRVLLVDDDPMTVRLVTTFLEALHADIEHAVNGKEAVEKALATFFDVLVMDMEMPVMDGFQATEHLRKKGYTGLIVAATALDTPSDRERCLQAGCDRYLKKPYTKDDLAALFSTIKAEPLFSSLANDNSMSELINDFVTGIPAKLRTIEETSMADDHKQLEYLARTFKGQAGGHGFEPISTAAGKLEQAVRSGAPKKEIEELVNGLAEWCMLARPVGN